jgi:hypothetical protein
MLIDTSIHLAWVITLCIVLPIAALAVTIPEAESSDEVIEAWKRLPSVTELSFLLLSK